ncbi:hypothetical protein CDL12_04686 [Handroanthus impetiginosus]|uniref:Uncharacterized protein n=1 Tax=Handroanthus impetiginosus TaxID=429701 RepID=A0A2G9HYK6_9LAMI|nr:hypothetical protein CDL12_04686 [Handroanthus impetiginosus]
MRPLLRLSKQMVSAYVTSSPSSNLEEFGHNLVHGNFEPLAFQPSAMTNCADQRLLSY